jgi:hypothetical protein
MTASTASRTTGWLSAADCSIDDFAALVDQQTHLSDYPYADAVERSCVPRSGPPPAGARCRPS